MEHANLCREYGAENSERIAGEPRLARGVGQAQRQASALPQRALADQGLHVPGARALSGETRRVCPGYVVQVSKRAAHRKMASYG